MWINPTWCLDRLNQRRFLSSGSVAVVREPFLTKNASITVFTKLPLKLLKSHCELFLRRWRSSYIQAFTDWPVPSNSFENETAERTRREVPLCWTSEKLLDSRNEIIRPDGGRRWRLRRVDPGLGSAPLSFTITTTLQLHGREQLCHFCSRWRLSEVESNRWHLLGSL